MQATSQLDSVQASLDAANAAIEALEESRAEDVKEQVEAARETLKKQLVTASRDGDHEGVADLTDKLTQLNTADDAVADEEEKDKDKDKKKNQRPTLHPEVVQWYKDNPDFATDARKSALANVIAAEMRQAGEASVGKVFLDKVAAEVDKTLGGAAGQRGTAKVEAGGGGGARGNRGGDVPEKTYADLPAEAKAACDKMSARLVGPNRAHKDVASWRKSYAAQYFKE